MIIMIIELVLTPGGYAAGKKSFKTLIVDYHIVKVKETSCKGNISITVASQ